MSRVPPCFPRAASHADLCVMPRFLLLFQSMYVRVKREKCTIFLHVEPVDTILEVKQKLQHLCEQVSWVAAPAITHSPASSPRRSLYRYFLPTHPQTDKMHSNVAAHGGTSQLFHLLCGALSAASGKPETLQR